MKIRIFALIIVAVMCNTSYADKEQTWSAHYLANAGVMIARGETKILFDPFFRNDYGQYDLVPEKMEAALFAGTQPWDGIDAIFNRVHGLELERNSDAVQLDMDGLLIEAVRIAHGGWPNRHADVENIVFRVTLDKTTTVMHLGDADAGREHYAPHISYWQARATNLALVPVWLMLTDKGRYVLEEHVDAEHEIGVHVYKSIAEKPENRPTEFKGLDIFTQSGETRDFE